MAIQAVSFVVIVIIMAVMANTMAMTARERYAEYATMKALGFGGPFVAGLVVAIPASAGYNTFVSRTGENEIAYYNFGSRVLSLFKRGDLLALEEVAGG